MPSGFGSTYVGRKAIRFAFPLVVLKCIIWTVFAGSTALLALAGAKELQGAHPIVAGGAALGVGLGIAVPGWKRSVSRYVDVIDLGRVSLATYYVDRLWFGIIDADVGLGINDLSVHYFLRRRRMFPWWRYRYDRVARKSKPTRRPAFIHGMWEEDRKSGRAEGLVGLAGIQSGSDVVAVNLRDLEHQRASEATWNKWYRTLDSQGLGVDFVRAQKALGWFSSMWAVPVKNPEGHTVGVLTINVERERENGHELLIRADARNRMREAASDLGASGLS